LPQTESRKAGGKTGDDAVQALDARAAFIVGDILSDNMARAPTFGTDSVLATRFWTAVKTGTSKDMRDNWAVGWSERYTVGVWVGNAGGEAMHSVSGTSGAAPIWAEIMGFCIAMCPAMRPGHPLACCSSKCSLVRWQAAPRPSKARVANGLWRHAAITVCHGSRGGQCRAEKPGRQKGSKSGSAAAAAAVRISRPANGTILALDPDIPPDSQRVQLVARQAGMAAEQDWRDGSLRWRLVTRQYGPPAAADKNAQPVMREVQRELGRGSQLGWLPWPGATGWSCSMPPARCWTASRWKCAVPVPWWPGRSRSRASAGAECRPVNRPGAQLPESNCATRKSSSARSLGVICWRDG
jgi:penicillin-binding protein 1C